MRNTVYASKGVKIWLITGIILISCMVFIGGVTRLTNSGLSMTEWNLIMGSVPPSNEVAWQEKFEQYKQYPEYKLVNQGMTLGEFKNIFFWEYFHRLWGRLMGVVFIIPFLYFIAKKQLTGALLKRCIIILIGGASVGALGWFMVLSGLQERPDVSHYRLALHLFAALSLICYVYYTYLKSSGPKKLNVTNITIPKKIGFSLLIILFVQIIWGAFTAGLDAGSIYNTYPLMNGDFIPENAFPFDSFIKNISDHRDGVQLIHRYLGTLIFVLLTVFGLYKAFKVGLKNTFSPLLFSIILQFVLGVSTLLVSESGIPVWMGSAHQMGAILVLLSCIYLLFGNNNKAENFA